MKTKYRDLSDNELVLLVMEENNERAFGEIYFRYYKKIFNFIKYGKYTLLDQSIEIDDLTQDTFLLARRGLQKKLYRKEHSNLFNWLRKIAVNNYINLRRRSKRFEVVSLYFSSIDDDNFKVLERSFLLKKVEQEPIELKNAKLFIGNIIGKMSPMIKNVWPYHQEGYKYEQIAKKENIPIGTVRSRIHRVRKELQEKLISKERTLEKLI